MTTQYQNAIYFEIINSHLIVGFFSIGIFPTDYSILITATNPISRGTLDVTIMMG